MLRDSILEIFKDMWPMIVICIFIISLLRIVYLIKNKEKVILYKELIMLGFVIYIMCLFRVVTFEDITFSPFNLTLFKEISRYKLGSKLFFKNVVGNTVMFIPFGFFISYMLKEKRPYIVLAITTLTSIVIELTQYKIGRVFDIDDILLNIFGGLIGFIIYYLIIIILNKLPTYLKKDWIYNIIAFILILVFILYLLGDLICLK